MSYKLINFCEFDKNAEQAYCAIHSVDSSLNLGDITKVNENEIADFNMIVGGSPCQDFSCAGKQKGAEWTCKDCLDDNGEPYSYNPLTVHYTKRDKCPNCNSTNIEKTRSSLLVEWLRVLKKKMPNFGIYENVKNIVGKQFKTTFDLFENELREYGYNTHWKILNAKDYGIPQNRERIYLILIKKKLDNGKFEFPKPFDSGIRLKDLLERDVDESFYISQDKVDKILNSSFMQEKFRIQNSDICGCLLARDYKDPKCVPIDKSYNNPKPIDVANCITAREDRGVNNRLKEGTAILENKVSQVGNYIESGKWGNPQVGRVYDSDGCCPTLNTMQGGDRQPKILQTPRGFNKGGLHDEVPTISSHSWECNNFITEPFVVASRGRNPDNPSDRTKGSPTEQRLEPNFSGCANTITTVQKDCMVAEPQVLRPERTEYGKQIRKAYESGEIQESRHNMTSLQPRTDGVCGTLTTVLKDNLLYEPKALCPQRQYDENGTRSVEHSVADTVPTILATQYKSGDNQCKIYQNFRIRKLTPKECWRLMGFTDEDFHKAQKGINDAFHKGKDRANSQLYKIAGNSIVTNVLFHIYIEMYRAMPYLFEDIKLSSFFSGCGAFEKALDNFFNYIKGNSKDESSENFTQPPIPQTTSSSLAV